MHQNWSVRINTQSIVHATPISWPKIKRYCDVILVNIMYWPVKWENLNQYKVFDLTVGSGHESISDKMLWIQRFNDKIQKRANTELSMTTASAIHRTCWGLAALEYVTHKQHKMNVVPKYFLPDERVCSQPLKLTIAYANYSQKISETNLPTN
jgi:hypothetical protein